MESLTEYTCNITLGVKKGFHHMPHLSCCVTEDPDTELPFIDNRDNGRDNQEQASNSTGPCWREGDLSGLDRLTAKEERKEQDSTNNL